MPLPPHLLPHTYVKDCLEKSINVLKAKLKPVAELQEAGLQPTGGTEYPDN